MRKALTILVLMSIIAYPCFHIVRKLNFFTKDDASELLYTGIYFIFSMLFIWIYKFFKYKILVIGAGNAGLVSLVQYSDFLYEEQVTPRILFLLIVGFSALCLLISLIIYLYEYFRNR